MSLFDDESESLALVGCEVDLLQLCDKVAIEPPLVEHSEVNRQVQLWR